LQRKMRIVMNVITIKIGGYINTIMLKKMPYRAIMELINNYIISKLINLLNLYNMGVPSLLKSHLKENYAKYMLTGCTHWLLLI